MKKIILLILTITTICATVIIPHKAYSLDITAGATAWLLWGNRNEDLMSDWREPGPANFSSRYGNNTNYSFDPSFLYGPVISIKFNNDFNLTFVYLYGQLEHKTNYKTTGSPSVPSAPYEAVYKFKRNDSDTALNYRLNDYFKVFIGAKYMRYDIKLSAQYTGPVIQPPEVCNIKHISYGPGLGLSSTYPLTENIFLLSTLSGFYLFSTGENFLDDGVYGVDPLDAKINYKEYGFNSTLAIAYYIAPASTVISLGGRLQYFKTDYDRKDVFYINEITNFMYGITLTATYSFSL